MYANRYQAGRKLAAALKQYRSAGDVVVLGLPRGGVVVAAEVAKALHAPLDVVLVRKIGHPLSSEFAIGAVVWGEKPVYNEGEGAEAGWLDPAVAAEEQLNERRRDFYYTDTVQPIPLTGKIVIIVDDGIATGLTMRAAVRAARRQQAKQVIVAIPVAPPDSVALLKREADAVVVLEDPETFIGSVGAHYQSFHQVDDETVRTLLHEHRQQKDADADTGP